MDNNTNNFNAQDEHFEPDEDKVQESGEYGSDYDDDQELAQNAAKSEEEAAYEKRLKGKYGELYKITTTLTPDDDTELEKTYYFKKPKTPSYDRYLKLAPKSMSKAFKTFAFDNIIAESKDELEKDLLKFPALGMGLGEKLLNILGLAETTNLKRL